MVTMVRVVVESHINGLDLKDPWTNKGGKNKGTEGHSLRAHKQKRKQVFEKKSPSTAYTYTNQNQTRCRSNEAILFAPVPSFLTLLFAQCMCRCSRRSARPCSRHFPATTWKTWACRFSVRTTAFPANTRIISTTRCACPRLSVCATRA